MKIKYNRLNHINICIPKNEEEKARAFYCGILGLEEIEKPDSLKSNGGFWLRIADIELHIGTEDVENKSKRHPAFEIENLEEVKTYLIEKGIKVKKNTPIPSVNRFSFYDPYNNRIEFLQKINPS